MNLHRHFCAWLLCLSAIGLGTAQPSFPLGPIGSPPGVEILATAALPDGELYALATGMGMLRTEDHGQTWTEANQGLPNKPWERLIDLTVSPGGDLYALYDFVPSRLYKWDENGSWQQLSVSEVPGSSKIISITFNPQGDMLLGTNGSAIFKSSDGGASFSLLISQQQVGGLLEGLYAFGNDQNYLYGYFSTGSRLYAFNDDGSNLQNILETDGTFNDLHYDAEHQTILLSISQRLLISADAGSNWQQIEILPGGNFQPRIEEFLIAPDGSLYAWGANRFFLTPDGGFTWEEMPLFPSSPLFLSGTQWSTIAFAPENHVFLSNRQCAAQGFYHSSNGGQDWNDLSQSFERPSVRWIAKGTDGTLFAEACSSQYVLYSEDDGETWQEYVIQPQGQRFNLLVINEQGQYFGISPDNTLHRSLNAGVDWETIDSPSAFPLFGYYYLAFGHDGDLFFVGELDAFKTTDQGETWTPIDLPSLNTFSPYTELLVHPDGRLFFLVEQTIQGVAWQSTDGGISWEPAELGLPQDLFSFTTGHITARGTVLVSRFDGSSGESVLHVSLTDGQAFELRGDRAFLGFASNVNGDLFARTDRELLYSGDDGQTWAVMAEGLPDEIQPSAIHLAPDQRLYLGLRNDRIHRTVTPTSVLLREGPPEGRLLAVPNPAGPETLLQLSGLPAADYHLELYSAHGQLLRRVAFHGLAYRLERQGLPGGLYLARVREARSGRVVGLVRVVF